MDSFQAAWDKGADYIETDVQISKDGHLFALHSVLPHEHIFDQGISTPLNQLDWQTICQLHTGRHRNGRIPLLEEILHCLPPTRQTPWQLNIEIKGAQGVGQEYDGHRLLEKLALVAAPFSRNILWSSFCVEHIMRMSSLLPASQFGILFSEQAQPRPIYSNHAPEWEYHYLPWSEHSLNTLSEYLDPAKTWVHPETSTLNPNTIRLAQEWKGINSWSLFAPPPDIPYPSVFSHITDYL